MVSFEIRPVLKEKFLIFAYTFHVSAISYVNIYSCLTKIHLNCITFFLNEADEAERVLNWDVKVFRWLNPIHYEKKVTGRVQGNRVSYLKVNDATKSTADNAASIKAPSCWGCNHINLFWNSSTVFCHVQKIEITMTPRFSLFFAGSFTK